MSAHRTRPLGAWAALTLLCVIGCKGGDGVSDYDRLKQGQEDAATALRHAGGQVTEVKDPRGDHWTVVLRGLTITDDVLDQLKSLKRITALNLSKSTITDDQLGRINEVELSGLLRDLDLSHTGITDDGLDRLTNLGVLGKLNLAGTKVTDAGVARFKKRRQDDSKIPALFKSPNVLR